MSPSSGWCSSSSLCLLPEFVFQGMAIRGPYHKAALMLIEVTAELTLGFPSRESVSLLIGVNHRSELMPNT